MNSDRSRESLFARARSWLLATSVLPLVINCSACKKLSTPIEAPTATLPSLSFVRIATDTVDTDTIPGSGFGLATDNVLIEDSIFVFAADSSGIADVTGMIFTPDWVLSDQSSFLMSEFDLYPTGKPYEYAGLAIFQIFRYEVGNYNIRIQSVGNEGFGSVPINIPLFLKNSADSPPVIGLASMSPDTILHGTNDTVLLQVAVTDPESWNDIYDVTAQITQPDGTSGGTIYLFDDGLAVHGDAAKGDGTFSALIVFNSAMQPALQIGTYKYKVIAQDKSGKTTNRTLKFFMQ